MGNLPHTHTHTHTDRCSKSAFSCLLEGLIWWPLLLEREREGDISIYVFLHRSASCNDNSPSVCAPFPPPSRCMFTEHTVSYRWGPPWGTCVTLQPVDARRLVWFGPLAPRPHTAASVRCVQAPGQISRDVTSREETIETIRRYLFFVLF